LSCYNVSGILYTMEKFINKGPFKFVSQGGIRLCGGNMNLFPSSTWVNRRSEFNCGKVLIGGGFNPNNEEELLEAYVREVMDVYDLY